MGAVRLGWQSYFSAPAILAFFVSESKFCWQYKSILHQQQDNRPPGKRSVSWRRRWSWRKAAIVVSRFAKELLGFPSHPIPSHPFQSDALGFGSVWFGLLGL